MQKKVTSLNAPQSTISYWEGQEAPENYCLMPVRGFFYRLVRGQEARVMKKPKNHRLQITLALIGVAGALGGALLTNWHNIFPQIVTPPVPERETLNLITCSTPKPVYVRGESISTPMLASEGLRVEFSND
jgi:hypothetical protein